MKKLIAIALICINCFGLERVTAQDIRQPMRDAYTHFKELQIYIKDSDAFSDPRNSQAIKLQLELLKSSFHKVDKLNSTYKAEPGFVTTLNLVNEMLDDTTIRFSEDKKAYAFWRIKTLSNHCVTCHVTYNAKLYFEDKDEAPKSLTDIQKAEFYLSTRQFNRARELLPQALKGAQTGYRQMELLRRWLAVEIRVGGDPKKTYATLSKLIPDLKLFPSDLEEVTKWVASLKKWSEETPESKSLKQAERVMRDAMSGDLFLRRTDPVGLLRGTSLIHTLLTQKLLKQNERARALYLLGVGYNQLTLFLIGELPEMYLELCIEEFGGTDDAKMAFKLYEEIVAVHFSGSGGTHIPADVAVRLIELYKKANGIPEFDGKV